ncbi:MAG: hypothetical protein MK066_04160 [Crocinitomicaceae bacterium]|nr:hypothetical protein [Crocinitomicaceae bacterium]
MKRMIITLIALGGFVFASDAQEREKIPTEAPRVTRPFVKDVNAALRWEEGGREVLMKVPSRSSVAPAGKNQVKPRKMIKTIGPREKIQDPEKRK